MTAFFNSYEVDFERRTFMKRIVKNKRIFFINVIVVESKYLYLLRRLPCK